MSVNFKECQNILDKTTKIADEIYLIKQTPENYINQYFENIKQKVVTRRDNLKKKIEKYSNNLLQEISETQVICRSLTNKINDISSQIKLSKSQLNDLVTSIGLVELNEKKYEEIKVKSNVLQSKLSNVLEEFKRSLIGEKEYKFVFDEANIEHFVGSFISAPWNYDLRYSKIIDSEESRTSFVKLCEFSVHQNWRLIYRASEDGFSSEMFHSKCDGLPNTLTVIKSKRDCIFGGYTSVPWSTSGKYYSDKSAFIFSLVNRDRKPFKVKTKENSTCAIYCDAAWGPSFGGGSDLAICGNSNTIQKSYSDFSLTYKHPGYAYETNAARSILAGSYYFLNAEIEVYCIVS